MSKRSQSHDADDEVISFELGPNLFTSADLSTQIKDPLDLYNLIRQNPTGCNVKKHCCDSAAGEEGSDCDEEDERLFRIKMYENCIAQFERSDFNTSDPRYRFYKSCCQIDFGIYAQFIDDYLLAGGRQLIELLESSPKLALSGRQVILRIVLAKLFLFHSYCQQNIDPLLDTIDNNDNKNEYDSEDENVYREVETDIVISGDANDLLDSLISYLHKARSLPAAADSPLIDQQMFLSDQQTVAYQLYELVVNYKSVIEPRLLRRLLDELCINPELWSEYLFPQIPEFRAAFVAQRVLGALDTLSDNREACDQLVNSTEMILASARDGRKSLARIYLACALQESLGHLLMSKILCMDETDEDATDEVFERAVSAFESVLELDVGGESGPAIRVSKHLDVISANGITF